MSLKIVYTEEEIKKAAIRLCELEKQDPFQEVDLLMTDASFRTGELWEARVSEIERHINIAHSLAWARFGEGKHR